MMRNKKVFLNKQKGVVLIVSLVMLVLLTLIGLTGSRVTSLEEKMAGNARDQNTAFQAAESTFLAAEQFILANSPDETTYTGNGGLLFNDDVEPDFFATASWSGANSATTVGFGGNFINNVTTATAINDPKYIIQRIDQFPTKTIFRITVRAVGHNPGTQIILQEVFERPK